jgi:uncharacterized protein YkwD
MKHVQALVVIVLTTALTAACSSNPASPSEGSTNFETELTFCITETNRYRATLGLSPLTRSSALEAYAAAGAQEDGLAHVAHQHFRSTNGGGVAFAKNVIPWWRGTSCAA